MDKSWIMDMEEDAIDMSAEAWCEKYGESLIEVYHEARRKYADLLDVEFSVIGGRTDHNIIRQRRVHEDVCMGADQCGGHVASRGLLVVLYRGRQWQTGRATDVIHRAGASILFDHWLLQLSQDSD